MAGKLNYPILLLLGAMVGVAVPHINELKLVKFGGITLQSIHFSFASLLLRL